jgi:hypothetical protein
MNDPSLWEPLHAEPDQTTADALELLREVKFQQRYQMRHRNSRSVGAISRRIQELAAIVEQTLTQDVRALLESFEGTSVPGKTSASRIPPAGRRFSTR